MATTQSVYRSLVREVNKAVCDSANSSVAFPLTDPFLQVNISTGHTLKDNSEQPPRCH